MRSSSPCACPPTASHQPRSTRNSGLRSGTAIELHGGANATLTAVAIEGNDGVGLYLDGKGTIARALDLAVRKNRVHPAAKDAFAMTSAFNRVGAIEVASDAELYVDHFDIADNEVIGVLVRNRGAAHLHQGTITGTTLYKVEGLPFSYGGTNVVSRNEAKLELTSFTSSRAAFCGLPNPPSGCGKSGATCPGVPWK